MNGTKSIFASRTIWGVIIMVIAAVAEQLGYSAELAGEAGEAVTLTATAIGAILAVVGRFKAERAIKISGGTPLPLLLLSVAYASGSLSGCAGGNASSYYARAAATERVAIEAVVTYDQVAAAIGDTAEEKTARLQQAKLATDAIASLTDTLKEHSAAYQAARAAGNDAAMREASDAARITYRAFDRVATQLLADLAGYYARDAP